MANSVTAVNATHVHAATTSMAQIQLQPLGWVRCDLGVTAMTVTAITAGVSRAAAATVVLMQTASLCKHTKVV